jgi:hypothetical protein
LRDNKIKELPMNKTRFSQLLYFGMVLVLAACQGVSQRHEMIQPGGNVDGMSFSTGAQDAAPLWAFCSPAQYIGNTTTSHCNVPALTRLAIGYVLMPSDDALSRLDWSEINWELTIDGQPIDLDSFGNFNFVQPALSRNLAAREVFVQFTAWDVVLTNLNPGEHIIQGLAQRGNDRHTWVLHLTIEGNDLGTGTPWAGFDIQETS